MVNFLDERNRRNALTENQLNQKEEKLRVPSEICYTNPSEDSFSIKFRFELGFQEEYLHIVDWKL
ncbi:hypothetical protein [Methylacidiphilum kamchatkense]|uniref:hypothetical protein n=1 Tax=Methylacidiphilum kamchatkense TaxID=431057 RepID=UPI00117D3155|nr:hypothetical protein [Methylacidiphilum kamchatkense]